jgi:hypothetical protein
VNGILPSSVKRATQSSIFRTIRQREKMRLLRMKIRSLISFVPLVRRLMIMTAANYFREKLNTYESDNEIKKVSTFPINVRQRIFGGRGNNRMATENKILFSVVRKVSYSDSSPLSRLKNFLRSSCLKIGGASNSAISQLLKIFKSSIKVENK